MVRMGRLLDGVATSEDVCMIRGNIWARWHEATLAVVQTVQEAQHQSSWTLKTKLQRLPSAFGLEVKIETKAHRCA